MMPHIFLTPMSLLVYGRAWFATEWLKDLHRTLSLRAERSFTMTGQTVQRTRSRVRPVVYGATLLGLFVATTLAFADKAENTLLVWAGDQAHVAPDFVAVIDFDRHSPHYGKVLRTVPLSGPNAVGNEPHHVGVSRDGRTLALGVSS